MRRWSNRVEVLREAWVKYCGRRAVGQLACKFIGPAKPEMGPFLFWMFSALHSLATAEGKVEEPHVL